MVDALSSGGSECMLVGVQLPPLAPASKGLEPKGSSSFALFGTEDRFAGFIGFLSIHLSDESTLIIVSTYTRLR